MVLLFRQSKKKKKKVSQSVSKVPEESVLEDIKNITEIPQEVEIEGIVDDEIETKVDDNIEKEFDDSELDTNPIKNEKEIIADESLADVESLPESQPEQSAKSSKSSKRSSDRKSKSRSSRTSKYL